MTPQDLRKLMNCQRLTENKLNLIKTCKAKLRNNLRPLQVPR